MQTVCEPYFFEKGPRTFKASRSESLLELIEMLELKDEIISAQSGARYLWKDGKLRKISLSLLSWKMIYALIKEWRIAPKIGDETICEFSTRRFGKEITETFIEPLTLGIYAGDIRKLSVSACFPALKEWENMHGSVLKGMFKREKKQKGLFSLKHGLSTLVSRLQESVPIFYGCKASCVRLGEGVIVECGDQVFKADHLVVALPATAMQSIEGLEGFEIPSLSLTLVHLAYNRDVLSKKGFGYLVPSTEGEQVLGVVFDSAVFPQQNRSENETRLTVMIRGNGDLEIAKDAVKRHLKIDAEPVFQKVAYYPDVLPQFEVDHLERLEKMPKHPQVTWIGNYLKGVSVNACISQAKEAAGSFQVQSDLIKR